MKPRCKHDTLIDKRLESDCIFSVLSNTSEVYCSFVYYFFQINVNTHGAFESVSLIFLVKNYKADLIIRPYGDLQMFRGIV